MNNKPSPMGKLSSSTKEPKGKVHVLIIGIHPGKSLGKKSPKSSNKPTK